MVPNCRNGFLKFYIWSGQPGITENRIFHKKIKGLARLRTADWSVYSGSIVQSYFLFLSFPPLCRHHVRVIVQLAAAANVTPVLNVKRWPILLIIKKNKKYNRRGKKWLIDRKFLKIELSLIPRDKKTPLTCTEWPGCWPHYGGGPLRVKLFKSKHWRIGRECSFPESPFSKGFLSPCMPSCNELSVCQVWESYACKRVCNNFKNVFFKKRHQIFLHPLSLKSF